MQHNTPKRKQINVVRNIFLREITAIVTINFYSMEIYFHQNLISFHILICQGWVLTIQSTNDDQFPSQRVVVSGLQAVCHVLIMRRWSSNLEQLTIQRPRLWVPSPYSLSPTRRSKPAFQ